MWLPAWLANSEKTLKGTHTHEILEKTKAAAFLNTWLANSEKTLKGTHT
jgi:hypothetical protein